MADDFDPFDDIFGDEPAKNPRAAGKFCPKPKFQPQKKVPAKSSIASSQSQVVQIVHFAPNDSTESVQNVQTAKPLDHGSSVLPNDSTKQAGQTIDSAPTELSEPFKNVEQLEHGLEAVLNDKSDSHAKSVEENAEFMIGSEDGSDFLLHTNNLPDAAENNLSPTFQNDDIVDLSSLGFTHTSPTESAAELTLNEESINLMDVTQMDSTSHMEGLLEIPPAKLASRRAKAGDSDPQQQKASTSSLENGAGRSLRSRKRDTNMYRLVDEDEHEDETHASGEFSKERPYSSTIDEENINIEQPQVESESPRKKMKRKLKKTENDKEKRPRKSKKAKEASEQETCAKQKRFKHSTRRRQVDKNLLNIPEDEFNPREVSLRDLILLAEHREKQMKTGAVSAEAPATHQSNGNPDYNNHPAGQYYNDPGQYDNDGEEGPILEDTTEYFNYQSRMEKTPRGRWTKQDDELFYEAVQQFGTDFSMIAQLFPGRSREQIRNKYKKEDRQHPLRLREAMTNRSRDNSHIRKVIENLNKIRAEQEEEENLEDFMSTGEQDEEASNINNDDEGKNKHVEEEENGDNTNGNNEVQSPAEAEAEAEAEAKAEKEKEKEKVEEKEKEKEKVEEKEEFDEEDEMFLFSQYKSDF